jgi:hypothetical protein
MDARRETPDNLNMLSPLIFKFVVKKLPNVTFGVQNINLPGVSMGVAYHHNPFTKIPYAGDHLEFDDIMINYKVDEDLTNYMEILDWLMALGFPKNFDQYKAIKDRPQIEGEGLKSDISLVVMNSNRIPKWNVVFHDAFPISISSLIFDTTLSDDQYLEAACTFKYTRYEIEQIT